MPFRFETTFEKLRSFDGVMQKAIENGNLALAVTFAGNAKLLAPVDFGQLRNGIQYQVGGSNIRGGLNSGVGEKAEEMTTRLKSSEAAVMSSADYSAYVEFGTRRQPAQPFMRPAAVLASGAGTKEVIDAIKEEVKKGAKKAPRKKEKL